MLIRQRLGIAMLFLFLPINTPFWEMLFESIGYPIPYADWEIFISCLSLFLIGSIFTFTPKMKFPLDK